MRWLWVVVVSGCAVEEYRIIKGPKPPAVGIETSDLVREAPMRTFCVLVLLATSSCVSSFVLMRNDDGDIQRCDGSAQQITGGLIGAEVAVQNCVEQYRQAGYHRVSDEKLRPKKKVANAAVDREFESDAP